MKRIFLAQEQQYFLKNACVKTKSCIFVFEKLEKKRNV